LITGQGDSLIFFYLILAQKYEYCFLPRTPQGATILRPVRLMVRTPPFHGGNLRNEESQKKASLVIVRLF